MKPNYNIYLIFDLLILNIAIVFVALFNMGISNEDFHPYLLVYLLHGNLSFILTSFVYSKNSIYLSDGFAVRFFRISKQAIIFITLSAIIGFLTLPENYSWLFIIEYWILFYAIEDIFYWIFYHYQKFCYRRGYNMNHAVIIGKNRTETFLRDIIDNNPILGYKFAGYISKGHSNESDVLSSPEDLSSLLDKQQIQTVFVVQPPFSENNYSKDLLKVCDRHGVRLKYIPENQDCFKLSPNCKSINKLCLVNPHELPLDKFWAHLFKRSFDIAFSLLIILLIMSWLLPILIVLVKLSSKGSVFFVQKRTGLNNRTFNCYKIRSMQINDQADTKQATAGDCRITRVGQFMRKTNVDELPQFFNVFLGQMSVVGPRPHMLKHTEKYAGLINKYMMRHYVKPGITGWAQVNGLHGETDALWKMEKRVDYDIEYIEKWTFWLDLKIIWKTIFDKKSFYSIQ